MKTIDSSPKKDHFRMPGEFSAHEGVYMLWPQRPDNWRDGGKPAQRAFAEVARAIANFEPVTMGVNSDQYDNACHMLREHIQWVVEIANNDSWVEIVVLLLLQIVKEKFEVWIGHSTLGAGWKMDFISLGIKTIKLHKKFVKLNGRTVIV